MTPIPRLRPADVLLYRGGGIFSAIIRVKTWSHYSHCEVNDGRGVSVASRDGKGVGRYAHRADGLSVVLRPYADFRLEAARAWFETVDGQGYDWLGLLAFSSAKLQGKDNGRMFCSEFTTRYLRAGGIDPFRGYDADGIAPGEFVKSPIFDCIWRAP